MSKVKTFFTGHKKAIVTLGAVTLGAILAYVFFFQSRDAAMIISPQELTLLEKKEFIKAVSENGVTKSEDTLEVFASKALPVKDIHVEVGDRVKKDQILAELDDSAINEEIEKTKAAMASSGRSSSAQIQNAKAQLAEAQKRLADGTNPSLVSAENAVISAYDAWQAQEKTYQDFDRSLRLGYNDAITAAEANDHSLLNAKAQTRLNYDQSLSSAQRSALTAEQSLLLAEEKEKEAIKLQKLERDFSLDINHLTRHIEEATIALESAAAPKPDYQFVFQTFSEIEKLQKQVVSSGVNLISARNRENAYYWDKNHLSSSTLSSLEKKFQSLCEDLSNAEDRSSQLVIQASVSSELKKDISGMKDTLSLMQMDLQNLSSLLAGVKSDQAQYQAKAAGGPDAQNADQKALEQNALQDQIAGGNLAFSDDQKAKTQMNLQDRLSTLRKNADDAKHSYDSAVKNLEVAKVMAQDEIHSLQRAVNLAQAGGDNTINEVQLKFLKNDLEKSLLKAPIEGTVTELNLTKGQVPNTYAVKIETVDRLIVESQVKEFDVNDVKVGTPVEISSEALSADKVFYGKVESVDPVPIASLSSAGAQAPSNEVRYKVRISLDHEDRAIRPGMNVRIKYILDRKKDVFAVPSNAVYEKNGKSFVMVMTEGPNPEIREVEVKVSGENDFETIISSDQIKAGTQIINAPDTYSPGLKVRLGEKKPKKNPKD